MPNSYRLFSVKRNQKFGIFLNNLYSSLKYYLKVEENHGEKPLSKPVDDGIGDYVLQKY